MDLPHLHVVTDDTVLRAGGFAERARAVLESGGPHVALHLRGVATSGRTLHDLAAALLPVASEHGAWLVVNDRVDVALALGVPAVQLARRSLPPALARPLLGAGVRLGYSVHGPGELVEAEGADWVVVGAVFATRSHPGQIPAGPGLLDRIGRHTDLPLVAIGGVSPERVSELRAAGAAGVAALSGVWRQRSPAAAVHAYLSAWRRWSPPPGGETVR